MGGVDRSSAATEAIFRRIKAYT